MHDLVIRGGTIVDGTGASAAHRRRGHRRRPHHRGRARSTAGPAGGRRRRPARAAGLGRHPHPLRRPGHLGSRRHAVELARRHHGRHGQLRRRLRAGPARTASDFLIELMEGVEDIPGTALHEGIDWQWESFAEYLDALDRDAAGPRHRRAGAPRRGAGLRARRAGPRRGDRRRDRRDGRRLVEQALAAGAAGFTTSRTLLHSSKHGLVPGTSAAPDELLAIGDAIGRAGHGVFQLVSDVAPAEPERSWHGRARPPHRRDRHLRAGADAVRPRRLPRRAGRRRGSSPARASTSCPRSRAGPPACCSGCSRRCTRSSPTRRTGSSPTSARRAVRQLRQPEVRAPLARRGAGHRQRDRPHPDVALGPDLPARRSARLRARAGEQRRRARPSREGRRPQEVVLDWLLERDGRALLFAPLASYVDGDHDAIREMMTHPTHGPRPLRRRRPLRAHLRRQHADLPAHPLGARPAPRRTPAARAGRAPADRAHRGDLRLHRSGRRSSRASAPTST